LEEQLLTVLAGRAGEELIYGEEDLSTMQQRRLVLARRIVTKLVVSTGMNPGDKIGPRSLSRPKTYDIISINVSRFIFTLVCFKIHFHVDHKCCAQMQARFPSFGSNCPQIRPDVHST